MNNILRELSRHVYICVLGKGCHRVSWWEGVGVEGCISLPLHTRLKIKWILTIQKDSASAQQSQRGTHFKVGRRDSVSDGFWCAGETWQWNKLQLKTKMTQPFCDAQHSSMPPTPPVKKNNQLNDQIKPGQFRSHSSRKSKRARKVSRPGKSTLHSTNHRNGQRCSCNCLPTLRQPELPAINDPHAPTHYRFIQYTQSCKGFPLSKTAHYFKATRTEIH